MLDYSPTSLDEPLPFGKHEGDQLWEILERDPQYIRWLIKEADIDFQLDDEAWQKYQDEISRYEKYERIR
ncbi:hypothetical protein GGP94_003193 [Salinibacter ruber]|uniref:exodeoxyribonuclease X C-terminal domain-containing protein n=1 Tax=Salinibacter ruber TaxID=146919 RepID=UPI002167497B|nr:hypothetical protein [Salinibacter ruber]MCS4162745.1 hypothetical protein [Salinibacter ruber]